MRALVWNTASWFSNNWLHLNFTTCIVHSVNKVLYFPEEYLSKMMADHSKFNQCFCMKHWAAGLPYLVDMKNNASALNTSRPQYEMAYKREIKSRQPSHS